VGTGCAGPWEQYYTPNLKSVHFSATQQTTIRTVEPERLKAFSDEESKRRVESNVAIEDESAGAYLGRRERLLRALRVSERPNSVIVLGSSDFRMYSQLEPKRGELESFAKRIGADYAVVSEEYMGQVNATEYAPVTTYSQSYGTATVYGSGGSGTAFSQGGGSSTTYVPVQVTRNLFQYDVTFIRRIRASDPTLPAKLGVVHP
jgi:hypothetical protein